jgi:hypothetical protein
MAEGEVTCGSNSIAEFAIVAGTSPPFTNSGANFHGQISGGVLTINDMITPGSFTVGVGQTLFDAFSGTQLPRGATTCAGTPCSGSTTTITGLLTGSGGVGTYSVSDATITIANETMWAMNTVAPEGKPAATLQVREDLENTKCRDGSTGIATFEGIVHSNSFSPNTTLWVTVMLSSATVSGNPTQSTSFNNAQISVMTLGTVGVRGPFGIVQ